jgi:hypothetical protein
MLPTAEERLQELWSKAMAAHDPAEVESMLFQFRDALHEHIEKLRAEKHQEASAVTSLNGSDSELHSLGLRSVSR